MKRYLKTREVAEKLGWCQATIQRRCMAGKIPGAKRLGREWRIPEESVEVLFENQDDTRTKLRRENNERIVISTAIIDSAVRRERNGQTLGMGS
jgi:excisionase family DNA binding protein